VLSRLVGTLHELMLRGGQRVEWAGVAATRSGAWPKAPFPGGGPQVGWGLDKETAPFPPHKQGRCNSGRVGNMMCPAGGAVASRAVLGPGGQGSGKKIV